MIIGIIYFFVIVITNTLGSISGMGGGVIIKPVFDAIGYHSISAISFYSATAVFTMSIVSTWRRIKAGVKLNLPIALLTSVGSIFGGVFGDLVFEHLLDVLPREEMVSLVQIVITIIVLVFALIYTRSHWKSFNITKKYTFFLTGLGLGFIASLLGIGGGPINVAVLMLFFGMPIKDATFYSIITILFSQMAKLVTIGTTGGFLNYDLSMLWYIVPAAIIGGLLGAKFSNVLPEKVVSYVFQAIIVVVIILNIVNGIRIFV